jgi:hypothetical protein
LLEGAALPILACVVEGEGDEQSLPLLIRRIALDRDPPVYIEVFVSKRVGREKLVNEGGIESAVEQAALDGGPDAAILVLLDADDDCPAILGPTLLDRARKARPDRQVSVVLAKREYEAWFLAAAVSLRGLRGLPADLNPPNDLEGIRDAKGWLDRRMPYGRKYSETADQPALTQLFDLAEARQADSFDKCFREISRLIGALTIKT